MKKFAVAHYNPDTKRTHLEILWAADALTAVRNELEAPTDPEFESLDHAREFLADEGITFAVTEV